MLFNFLLYLAFLTSLDSNVTMSLLYTKRASSVYTNFNPGIYNEFIYITNNYDKFIHLGGIIQISYSKIFAHTL